MLIDRYIRYNKELLVYFISFFFLKFNRKFLKTITKRNFIDNLFLNKQFSFFQVLLGLVHVSPFTSQPYHLTSSHIVLQQ